MKFLSHLFALIIFCLANYSFALPPQTLDYQGYLADSNAVPLTGNVNLSIAIYDTSVGGVALWSQAGVSTLSNGRFNVVLDGSGLNPFPTGLFDQQLYIGLTVNADPEMTPRQPLTSVPSAFEAINADTLDGLQANEIIDAVSDVRTPISSLPITISQPGSYYLTQNLTATAGGGNRSIDITSGNVTIDLMGFTLEGNAVFDNGINLDNQSHITIKNGIISGFGSGGIVGVGSVNGNIIESIQLIGNGSAGTQAQQSGIYLQGQSQRVESCIVRNSGGYGIYVGLNSIVKDNAVSGSGGTYGIFASIGSTIINNTSYNHQGTGTTYGIYANSGAVVVNNTAYNNQSVGIRAGADSTLKNNVAYLNQGTYGIWLTGPATVVNNTSYNNQGWGIYNSSGSTIIGNTVTLNNRAEVSGRGGMYVPSDSQVKNNTVDSNNDTGIYIAGTDNVVRENHVTDSTTVNGNSRCFRGASSDNVYIGNTATGCGVEFSGTFPPAARFIDNISW